MDYKQLQAYRKQILQQTFNEGIRRNNEQMKIWTDYKKRHEKVLEGLNQLPHSLSVNCMVPIGKRALMPGKLVHTNEIMVCLGDGYFAKYSASQAAALCSRRIKKANQMLDDLIKERNLFETRQLLTDNFDLFGDDDKEELLEHWDDENLKKWRDEHRKRTREYRQKLSQLSEDQNNDITTEDDLFKRLDALELQEELEDELYKLEEEHPEFYRQIHDDEQYYDESEVDSESYSSDYSEDATEINEKKSSRINNRLKILNSVNCLDKITSESDMDEIRRNRTINYISTNENDNADELCDLGETKKVDRLEMREKKVAFAEPQVKYFSNEEEMEVCTERRRVSVIEQKLYEYSMEDDESEEESDEDDTIRIYIKHSDTQPELPINNGNNIVTPRDIYKLIPGPKSILKKTYNNTIINNTPPPLDVTTDEEESDDELEKVSAYNTVVKEIKERIVEDAPAPEKPAETQKRVSKFKLERAGLKK